MRRFVAMLLVAWSVVAVAPVAAAQKDGCSADASGSERMSVAAAATQIWPTLLFPAAFPGGIADLEAAIALEDRNSDGLVCVRPQGGDHFNPKSHWYLVGIELIGEPTIFTTVRDNNAGAVD